MALRLAGSSPADPRTTVADLRSRAGTLLAADDLRGYRALWAEAAEIDDEQRRYHARKLLLEEALEATAAASARRAPGILAAAAAEGISVLEEAPAEPQILNSTGVALYELWALDGAKPLFEAAKRLDPELPHVEGNLAEVRRRRKVSGGAPQLPAAVALSLPGLVQRAQRIAQRARPAAGLTVTLAMIVKDEEEMLPRCLEAAAPWVDEIVVVDTGSTDATVQIATDAGARVLHHPWDGDFSAARNVSFDAATSDWTLYLDADEVLCPGAGPKLRALLGHTWREAFWFSETNYTGDEGDGTAATHNTLRLFRNRPGYRFSGRLHEQISPTLPGFVPERLGSSTVSMEHYGYLGVVRESKDKQARNLEIIRRQIDEADRPTPFMLFNLGTELSVSGEPQEACEAFRDAWTELVGTGTLTLHGFSPALANRYVHALLAVGRFDEAEATARDALQTFEGYTDLVYAQAQIAVGRGEPERAMALFQRCLEMGDAPTKYTSAVGAGTFMALASLAALRRTAGDAEGAEDLLTQALREHPRYLGSVDPLAGAMLARGATAAEVVDRVESLAADMTPSVRFMLGTALYEAGEAGAAAEQFETVVDRQPASGAALTALAEALLSLREWRRAAETAAAVPDADPCAPAARRIEAFAWLAAGDPAGASAPLDRSTQAGLSVADRAGLQAWQAAEAGEAPAPAPLPQDAAAFIATALEALLKVQEFDRFQTLAGVLDRVALAPRARHEVLAAMYLRCGYLDSAADEWLTACEETGQDPAALVGLAQVAVARGMRDDALVLATEAHALDPAHQGAARLVAALDR